MTEKTKFRYHGEFDMPRLQKWLKEVGANTCSLDGDGERFVQVGRQQYTVGGNPKRYSRIGGVIVNTREDAWPLFEKLGEFFRGART